MDFKQLRAFLTIADTGNVTRAAEVLHLVQPAVSRQLMLLEQDLGTELFQRERHGMVLTEAGLALVDYARRALLELDRARAEITASANGLGGLVTLGLLPSTVEVLCDKLMPAIAKAYPGIRLRISMGLSGTLKQWLESGEIDAALLYEADPSPAIKTKALIEEALWVVGPPSAKLRKTRPVRLKSLSDKSLVLPSPPHGIRTLVDHACAVSHVELNITAETNAMSVQKICAMTGYGLTILPPIAIADDLEAKRLTAAPLIDPTITRTIVLALPTNRLIRRHVQCAVDLLVKCVEDATKSRAWPEARWLGS